MINKKTAFVFPGQGSQFVGMGKDLYDNFAFVRDIFHNINDILGVNLSQIMFEGPSEELTKTENTQPALMAVSAALITVFEKEFGKKIENLANFVAGHSLGEYSALYAAKSLTLEDVTKLLQVRGLAMAKCGEKTQGAMAAILGVEIEIVRELVKEASQGEVCQIANDNSVGQIVISGSKSAIERAILIAKEKGAKRAIALPVSGAFHSELMNEAAKIMENALSKTNIKSPIVPLVANVTAEQVLDSNQIKELLFKQVTGSVRWRETILFMEKNGVENIVEVGAGKVLSGLVGRTSPSIKSLSIQNLEDITRFLEL